jgi:hypothetical protein
MRAGGRGKRRGTRRDGWKTDVPALATPHPLAPRSSSIVGRGCGDDGRVARGEKREGGGGESDDDVVICDNPSLRRFAI